MDKYVKLGFNFIRNDVIIAVIPSSSDLNVIIVPLSNLKTYIRFSRINMNARIT